jgi:ankyrin repeat protein
MASGSSYSAISGAFSSVHALNQVNASVNYVGESNGKTALIHAAEYDDPEAISVLLEVNCAIDFVSGFGPSNRHCALTAAAKVGALKSLQFLLNNSANSSVEPTIGRTARIEAVDNNQLEAVVFLATALKEKDYETSARYTALVKAAMNENIEAIKVLRKCGEDMNYETSTGDTALIVASRLGNVAMVEELLVPSDDESLSNEATKTDVCR